VNELGTLLGHRVIPVVVIDRAADAGALADALVDGGLPVAEITFRTPDAEAALRSLAGRDDLMIGAGSIRTIDQVDRAVDAGSSFIVSPGLSAEVVRRCQALGIPIVPGVATPSEIMQALDLGVDVVKLFPADLLGGPPAVRALSSPFPSVRFVPTGGVGMANLSDYMALPSVAAVGGSWMVARDLIRNGGFDEIRRLTADAVAATTDVVR
jgi:2-dehydro-3-deoxyphosphogluconate aldolase/(4S)-4-hydroxy-2-oxoglutarate aldolase